MQMGHGHWGLLVLALSLSGCVALQPTQTEALQTRVPEPEMQTPLPEALAIADLELMAAPGEVCSPDVHLHLSEGIEWNLWDRVRGGFSLPFEANSRIDVERQWYTKNQAYLDRVAERAEPYLHFIVSELELRNMPAELALLPIVESAFQPLPIPRGARPESGSSFRRPGGFSISTRTGGMTDVATSSLQPTPHSTIWRS